ncbi:MAG: hypothetical protein C4348_00830 [Patescibacteria group bacterium]
MSFKKFFLFIFLASFLLFLSTKVLAQEQKEINYFSLKIQKLIFDFFSKFNIFNKETDEYKEKYFNLLKEISQIKLKIKNIDEEIKPVEKISNLIKLTLIKKDPLGIYYFETNRLANEKDIIVDENLTLIGLVTEKNNKYLVVKTLLYPGIEFNLANSEGKFIGLGKTTSNGFIEINFFEKGLELKKDMLVFSYGQDNLFPPNFLVGTVESLEKKNNEINKIIIKLSGNFESKNYYIYK